MIGIFDSGIGGLTVASAIHQLLPHEQLIYFGDTAHLPYGDKSPELIREYAEDISAFLIKYGCKVIVIACNTASAHAYQHLTQLCNVPVINVIDPVAEYVGKYFTQQTIGVIGTKGTINSGIYPRRIKKVDPTLKVKSLATPLLAPMIEEGFFNNKISQTVIASYLGKKTFQGLDAIILACTHYPLIKKQIDLYYQHKVSILDSASIVAEHLKVVLTENKLLSISLEEPEHHFFVSDYTESFEKSTKYFFKGSLKLEKIEI